MAHYERDFLDRLASRLGDYLDMTGRSTKKNFSCVSPDHADSHPSMHFYGTTCFCFSCGARYDLFKLIGSDFGIHDFRRQVEKACDLFQVSSQVAEAMTQSIREREKFPVCKEKEAKPKRNYDKLFSYCRARIKETDYPARRGLSEEIVKKAGLGYHPNFQVNQEGDTWPILIIPVDRYHFVARNTDPAADKNHRFHASSGGRALYTKFSDVEHSKKPIWIVEGEIDALSIADAGGEVIALGSTQNVSKLLHFLSEHHPPQAALILSLDSDDMGRKAQQELTNGLRHMGISYFIASKAEYKDANAFLQEDRVRFSQYVRRESLAASLSSAFTR